MKKLFLFWIALLIYGGSFGQSTANYAFSYAFTGSLVDISTGATTLLTGNNDDLGSTVNNIGFTFNFMGAPYTQFSINSNGQMRLGNTAIGGSAITGYSASVPILAPMAGDNEVNNGASFKVIGTAPNRTLVVEWNQFYAQYTNIAGAGNMQVLLHEGSGIIEFIYGDIYNSSSSSVTRSIFISSSNTATTGAHVTVGPTPTYTPAAAPVANTFAASVLIANLGSTAQGSRTVYTFTPPLATPADPTTLTFSAVTASTITPNWIDNSTDETGFIVTRATDASFTLNVNVSAVASSTTATTGTPYNIAQTGLTPGTTYYYMVQAANEGRASTGITGSQATTDGTIYYWVGTTGSTWGTAANWNTAADGSGIARTVAATSDVLVVDGEGIVAGAPTVISVDVASFSIGQFKVTSNTACTLQSSAATTRVITITGGPSYDFAIESGSSLIMNHGTQAVAFAFSGTGNTGDISGTYNAAGSTSNVINSTGGTGTLLNVSATGVVNNAIVGSSGCLTGSVATLSFTNGSSYTHSSYTTSNGYIPLATWGATSSIFITGGTTSTSITNAPGQTFGNFTYNSTSSTATCSAFTSSTATVIQGNLSILASNTGKVRIVTTGTLTINGNLIVSGGLAETSNSTGIINVLGNVSVSNGTLDIAFASTPTLKVAGNFIQTGGNIIQTSTTGLLEFNGTVAQTLTLVPGSHGTNAINARINNAAGVDLTTAFSIRNLTVSNGNLTGAGSLTYNGTTSTLNYNSAAGIQTATAVEFPAVSGPSSLTINNTATSPNNVVNIPFSRTLAGTAGVLTLTAGYLDNSTYTLTLSNTAVGAISGGSATSFVKGAIERSFPASLVTGSTYNFPVGKGTYNPFTLVNPTSNAGGTVAVIAEVFDANCGGTAGLLMGTLKTDRYWAASITSGSANFTNSLIRLNDAPAGADAIAASATLTGAYDLVGGVTITSTATSLTTTAPEATTIPGFYVMGNKAAPSISNLLITPSGNQCTNSARVVTATVTPGGGAVTGVVINYSVNGTAQAPVTMTNIIGNDWAGIIPTVTPVNANVVWSVTATDANLLAKTENGVAYTDEPAYGYTATASVTSSTVCSGSPTTLSLLVSNSSSAPTYVAPPAVVNPTTDEDFGNITITQGATTILNNSSTINTLTGTIGVPTGTAGSYSNYTAFGPYSITAGNTYNFSISSLQGASAYGNAMGIYIDYNRDGDFIDAGEAVYVSSATTSGAHTETGSFLVPLTASTGQTRMRVVVNEGLVTGPTMSVSWGEYEEYTLNILNPVPLCSWSDGSVVVGTSNPLTINPTVGATYTATVLIGGCPVVTNSIAVTVDSLPFAPTANNSTQCGVAVPACSVTSTSGDLGATFNWYTVSTGGTPIAGITGNTYTGAAVGVTTDFYVSETNGSCESNRVLVTATVGSAPALTITGNQDVCNNAGASIHVTSTLSDYDSYVWTPATDLYTDAGCTTPYVGGSSATTVFVKSATSGIVTYTCTANNSATLCSNVATTDVNVLPINLTLAASPSNFCNSGISSITVTPSTGFGAATFQWMSSMDNITFSDIVGAEAISYTTPTINDTMYYKMVVELGASFCTVSDTVTVFVNVPSIVSTTPASICGDGTVTLNATGSIGTTISWYDLATNGSKLGTGNSFTTPTISSTTNYYVAAEYLGALTTQTIGAGASTSSSSYTPFNGGYGGIKTQHLYTAAELNAAGLSAGEINSIALDITVAGTTYNGFTIQVGNTLLSNFTVTPNIQGGLTTVYTAASSTPTVGINTYSFSTPFNWDGTSNIIVSISWSNNNTFNSSATVKVDGTTNYSSQSYRKDSDTPANILAFTGTTGTLTSSQNRPQMRFGNTSVCASPRSTVIATVNTAPAISVTATPTTICEGQSTNLEATSTNASYDYEWTGSLTGATQTVSPAATTTYSVTATDNSGGANDGCVATGNVLVTVNPVPTAVSASASDSSICIGATINLFSTANAGTSPAVFYSESFENAGAIPSGWATDLDVDGNATDAAITFETATTYPSGFSATDGSYMAKFNSYDVQSGNSARLSTSTSFATTGMIDIKVNFDWLNSATYTNKDYLMVEYSTDGSTWVEASDTIFRFDATAHWSSLSVDLPAAANNQSALYIAFKFVSAYGNNCFLDNVEILGSDASLNYSWTSAPAGYTSASPNPTAVTPSATTDYIVTVENVHGCTASDDVTVNVGTYPVVNLGVDQAICDTTSITLDAGNAGSTFDWSTGGTSQTEVFNGSIGAGTYDISVEVTNAAGCATSDTVTITVTTCTGIENPAVSISIYPNPATDYLNLDLSQLSNGDYTFELMSMTGQQILKRTVINDGTVILVSLIDVAPGTYVVRLSGNNNSFQNFINISE